METDHLEPDLVVAYAAGRLATAERRRVEEHLSRCGECVSEVVTIHRLRRRRAWPAVAAAGGLAAAAAVLVLWFGGTERAPATPPDRIRGPGTPSVLRLDAVRPADGSVLDSTGFVWRAMDGAVAYRLTITNAAGDEVWNRVSSDTALSTPAGLQPGQTYFWYVDALRKDGVSATSGVRRFQTRK
jgi:hypothetical protein